MQGNRDGEGRGEGRTWEDRGGNDLRGRLEKMKRRRKDMRMGGNVWRRGLRESRGQEQGSGVERERRKGGEGKENSRNVEQIRDGRGGRR